MKQISALIFAAVALTSGVAMAKAKMDVKPFLGDYNLVGSGGKCAQTIKVIAGCDGFQVMDVINDKTYPNDLMCEIDKGANRDVSRGGGGHAIFPSVDFTKTVVTSNAEEKSVTKVEKETSVSIGIFSSTHTLTVKMDTPNQMVITSHLVTSASESDAFCTYMRK